MTFKDRWLRKPHTRTNAHSGTLHAAIVRKRRARVCSEFDKEVELEQLRETLNVELHRASTRDEREDAKLKTIRHLKRLFRCEGSFDDGVDEIRRFAPELEREALESAQTVLGGHLAAWAPWSKEVRDVFSRLGSTLTPGLEAQTIPGEIWGPNTPYEPADHRRKSEKSEPTNTRILNRAHILGCRGHHFTSHLVPGFFSDANTTRGFDLRYNLHAQPGGFPNIALMAVSGCSMLCELAQRLLIPCFPKARFAGSRNTMTLDAGDHIWPRLRQLLAADATPLILDNTQDIELFTHAWLRANIYAMHEEAKRILSAKGVELSAYRVHAKQTQLIKSVGPGFAEGRETVQLQDSNMTVKKHMITATENACERKADDRPRLPAPDGFKLPPL